MTEYNVFIGMAIEDAEAIMEERARNYSGPVMEPQWSSAWVQPNGIFRFVPECGHVNTARNLVPRNIVNPDDYLLEAGWVKVQVFQRDFSIFAHQRIRQAQVDVLWSIFMAAPENMRLRALQAIQRYIPDFGKVD
jgi:hypothetical protein